MAQTIQIQNNVKYNTMYSPANNKVYILEGIQYPVTSDCLEMISTSEWRLFSSLLCLLLIDEWSQWRLRSALGCQIIAFIACIFWAINIGIKHGFLCIIIHLGLGFQHLPRDPANVTAPKTNFNQYYCINSTTYSPKFKLNYGTTLHSLFMMNAPFQQYPHFKTVQLFWTGVHPKRARINLNNISYEAFFFYTACACFYQCVNCLVTTWTFVHWNIGVHSVWHQCIME